MLILAVASIISLAGAATSSASGGDVVETLAAHLTNMTATMEQISTCDHPINEFEQEIRNLNVALRGITDKDEQKYKDLLINIFNAKKDMQYSCIKTIAIVRDIVSRLESIDKMTTKLSKYEEPKLSKMSSFLIKRFRRMIINNIESLTEVRELVVEGKDKINQASRPTNYLTDKMEDLRDNGPPVEIEIQVVKTAVDRIPMFFPLFEQYQLVEKDHFKRKVKRNIKILGDAEEFIASQRDTNAKLVDALDERINKLKDGQALLEGTSPTPDEWTNLRAKFEEIRNKSEAFLAQGRGADRSEADSEEETKTQNGDTTPEVGQADVAVTSSIPVSQNDPDYE